MSNERITNLWKNEEGQESLTAKEQQLLPENPVGAFDLMEEELAEVVGGDKGSPDTSVWTTVAGWTFACC